MTSDNGAVQSEGPVRYWYRDGFFLTNDKSHLDPRLINDVFGSDLMWWNDPMELSDMRKMLDSCLTVGVYAVDQTEEQMKVDGAPWPPSGSSHKMVAFGRVVTDYTTFAYLTDVFVLSEFQGRGLARWLMSAVKTMVDQWPNLRGLMLMTDNERTARMYKQELGAVDFDKGPSAGLVLLEMQGRVKKTVPDGH
jgi:ribosomal protein S18 acetylase RimI-like enzyme